MFGCDLQCGALVASILIGALYCIYRFSIRNHDYWKKRNVPYIKPLPFVGSLWDTAVKSQFEVELERYSKYGTLFGHFESNRPLLSVGDPDLLRNIFVKDFQSFPLRRPVATGDRITDSMVAFMEGDDWKRVRHILTPTFTTGKIKKMTSIIKDCTRTLVQNIKKLEERGGAVNMKNIYAAFTIDIIASAAFSTKLDSHNDPENKFVLAAKNVFSTDFGWRLGLFQFIPGFMKLFNIAVISSTTTEFFRDVTLQIIEERKRTGQTRNDFLQLLMDLAEEEEEKSELPENDSEDITSNYASEESDSQVLKSVSNKKLSMDELVAQCVIFFLGGYDSVSTTLSFITYALALNPEVQEKAYEEVQDAVAETKGELTYEALQKMKYLDNVISETMRLWPAVARLDRACVSDYKLGDTGITIKKGMIITIPVAALHRDPKYYPDPKRFNPDRFNVEERSKRNQYVYLPFGSGPRNCLGMRFALVEVKVCLAYMISTFRFKRSPKTKEPLEFHNGVGVLAAKEILLELELRTEGLLLK